jgi:hypothetical protein
MKINVVHDFDTFFPAVDEDRKNIEGDCNEITFINNTDGVITINNFNMNPSDVLILGGNSFETVKTKFQISNSTATSGVLNVIRKRYL